MPEISVIIPAYNAENTIVETINSVLNQTFEDFELIIINDGSNDRTLDVIKKFKDNRISVHTFPNSGPSSARNKGLRLAKGNFISYVDADDLWSKDKLRSQFLALKIDPQADVAYSWTIFIDENGKYIHPLKSFDYIGDVYGKIILLNFVGSGSNLLIRRDSAIDAGYFDESLNFGEEWDYYIRLAKNSYFTLIKEYQIFYRQNSKSLSSSIEKFEEDSIRVIDKTYDNIPEDLRHLRNITLSNTMLYLAYIYLTRQPQGTWKSETVNKILKSVKINPFTLVSFTTWSLLLSTAVSYLLPFKYSVILTHYFLNTYGKLLMILSPKLKKAVLYDLVDLNQSSSTNK